MEDEFFKIQINKETLWWTAGGKILFHDILKTEESTVEASYEDCIKIINVSKDLKDWSWKNSPITILDYNGENVTELIFLMARISYFYQTFVKWPAFVTSAAIVAYIIYTFSTIPR